MTFSRTADTYSAATNDRKYVIARTGNTWGLDIHVPDFHGGFDTIAHDYCEAATKKEAAAIANAYATLDEGNDCFGADRMTQAIATVR